MYWRGFVKNSADLLETLLQHVTGPDMGADAWKIATRSDNGIILQGQGYTSGDSVYVGIQPRSDHGWDFWLLNGYKRYNQGLPWDKQPGAIDLRGLPVWVNRTIEYDKGNPYYVYTEIPNPPGYGLPAIVFLPNESVDYTIVANKHRIILMSRIGYVTNAFYLGFIQPYMQDIHYPYPLAVCGTTTGIIQKGEVRYSITNWPDPYVGIDFSYGFYDFQKWSTYRLFTDPGGNSISGLTAAVKIMRPDGTWTTAQHWSNGLEAYITNPNRQPGTPPTYGFRITNEAMVSAPARYLWPTMIGNVSYQIRDMDNQLTLLPFLFVEKSPHGVLGTYDGLYWVLGDGLARNSIAKVGDDTYAIFHNVHRTGKSDYFAVKLE